MATSEITIFGVMATELRDLGSAAVEAANDVTRAAEIARTARDDARSSGGDSTQHGISGVADRLGWLTVGSK